MSADGNWVSRKPSRWPEEARVYPAATFLYRRHDHDTSWGAVLNFGADRSSCSSYEKVRLGTQEKVRTLLARNSGRESRRAADTGDIPPTAHKHTKEQKSGPTSLPRRGKLRHAYEALSTTIYFVLLGMGSLELLMRRYTSA